MPGCTATRAAGVRTLENRALQQPWLRPATTNAKGRRSGAQRLCTVRGQRAAATLSIGAVRAERRQAPPVFRYEYAAVMLATVHSPAVVTGYRAGRSALWQVGRQVTTVS